MQRLYQRVPVPLSSPVVAMQSFEPIAVSPPILSAQVGSSSSPANRPTPPPATHDAALLLIPIGFIAIWAAVVCVISDTWKVSRKELTANKQLSQLPCKKCRFFNNNPYMKCAVNPHTAMTKAAMDCTDYLPRENKFSHHHSGRK